MSTNNIIFYGASWCGDCIRAKFFLDLHQIAYIYIDIDKDPNAADTVVSLNNGLRILPTIVFPDNTILTEPTNETLAKKLNLVA